MAESSSKVANGESVPSDVVLAELFGQAWLVRGEQHIDDLLRNMLHPDVSIEVVACESKSAIDALWYRWNDEPITEMWLIHPNILKRVLGNPAQSSIVFPAWSAALDDAASRVIDVAVKAAGERPDMRLALVRHVLPNGGSMAEDIGGLRCTLIEGRLVEAGVAAARLVRETVPAASAADSERIDLLLR